MNQRLALLLGVFLVFAAYTLYVWLTADVGLIAFLKTLPFNAWSTQILVDLSLACALMCVWMFVDTRARGKAPRTVIPFILLTVFLGTLGPLLYLIVRERSAAA